MKKNKIITLAIICLILAGCVLFTNEKWYKADIREDAVIVEGVYIGGVNVSGMTQKEATDAVNAYIETLKKTPIILKGPKADLNLTYGDLGLTANVETAVSKAISVAQYGNLIRRFMNQKDLEKDNLVVEMGLSIDKQAVAKMLHDKSAQLNALKIDNTVVRENGQFVFVEGQPGQEIDIVTSVKELSKLVSNEYEISLPTEDNFVLTSNTVEQKGTKEELATIKDLLGTFSTFYGYSTPERAQNVETGADKLNGIILFPGEEISVNGVTGPYTAENGYAKGPSFVNGEVEESFGGGICQVSTTIYNAALLAELEITQRSGHSMTVSYVDVSADAAIATGYKDLKFKNNYDTPIYIEGLYNQGGLQFNIYGQDKRPANRTMRFETEVITETRPASKYLLKEEYPIGFIGTAAEEHIGYSAKYWKIITVDGVDTEKVQINKTWYRASEGEYHIGTNGATPKQIEEIKEMIATNRYEDIKALVEGYVKTEDGTGTGTENGNQNGTQQGGSESAPNDGEKPENLEKPENEQSPEEQKPEESAVDEEDSVSEEI